MEPNFDLVIKEEKRREFYLIDTRSGASRRTEAAIREIFFRRIKMKFHRNVFKLRDTFSGGVKKIPPVFA